MIAAVTSAGGEASIWPFDRVEEAEANLDWNRVREVPIRVYNPHEVRQEHKGASDGHLLRPHDRSSA